MHGSSCLQCACHLSFHLAFSGLMIHQSSLLFLHGHFETSPDYVLTDAPVHTIRPNFSDQKAQVKRGPDEDEQFGNLAKFILHTDRRRTSYHCSIRIRERPLRVWMSFRCSAPVVRAWGGRPLSELSLAEARFQRMCPSRLLRSQVLFVGLLHKAKNNVMGSTVSRVSAASSKFKSSSKPRAVELDSNSHMVSPDLQRTHWTEWRWARHLHWVAPDSTG